MKRILAVILIVLLLGGITAYGENESFFTERKNKEHEAWLWEELSKHSPSDAVTAGVLGYFWRESQYRSDSVSGWATILNEQGYDICKTIRKNTDKGLADGSSKEYFLYMVRQCGGYGLGQWYSIGYLESLYDFASEYGTSIGDARMQCEFIFHSMQENEELWKKLKKCDDAERAGKLIGTYYDGSEHGADYMGYRAVKYYEKYHIETEE